MEEKTQIIIIFVSNGFFFSLISEFSDHNFIFMKTCIIYTCFNSTIFLSFDSNDTMKKKKKIRRKKQTICTMCKFKIGVEKEKNETFRICFADTVYACQNWITYFSCHAEQMWDSNAAWVSGNFFTFLGTNQKRIMARKMRAIFKVTVSDSHWKSSKEWKKNEWKLPKTIHDTHSQTKYRN